MSNRYNTLYRITFYLLRLIIFGLFNLLLTCLAEVGCKGFEEVLKILEKEQRDCENFHGNIYAGAWKLFCCTLAFVVISRYYSICIFLYFIKRTCIDSANVLNYKHFRSLLHKVFDQTVSIGPLDTFWKYMHGFGGFCQILSLLHFLACAGKNICKPN